MVIVPVDGPAYATTNIDPEMTIDHTPTKPEMRRACHDVVDDINAFAASEYIWARMQTGNVTVAQRVRKARERRQQEPTQDTLF